MRDAPAGTSDRPAYGARHDPPSIGLIRTLVGVQLYTVTAYVAAAIIPYLWSPRPYPPTWTWIVPGWLFGFPGHYITALGPMPGILLGLAGVGVLVLARRDCPTGLYRGCLAATTLAVAYGLFALTPLARTIAVFVAH